ncbi:hypothetical protein IAU60_001891 [Kwoniella sp. DSM 27419]
MSQLWPTNWAGPASMRDQTPHDPYGQYQSTGVAFDLAFNPAMTDEDGTQWIDPALGGSEYAGPELLQQGRGPATMASGPSSSVPTTVLQDLNPRYPEALPDCDEDVFRTRFCRPLTDAEKTSLSELKTLLGPPKRGASRKKAGRAYNTMVVSSRAMASAGFVPTLWWDPSAPNQDPSIIKAETVRAHLPDADPGLVNSFVSLIHENVTLFRGLEAARGLLKEGILDDEVVTRLERFFTDRTLGDPLAIQLSLPPSRGSTRRIQAALDYRVATQ